MITWIKQTGGTDKMFKRIRKMFREYERACFEAAKNNNFSLIYTPKYGMIY